MTRLPVDGAVTDELSLASAFAEAFADALAIGLWTRAGWNPGPQGLATALPEGTSAASRTGGSQIAGMNSALR